jgi:hypothetical protein
VRTRPVKITILEEHGYESALRGLSKNKKQPINKMPKVAERLASKDGGHNKFLEAIMLWVEIDAPRYWWAEADTYRIGNTKQSESTIFTLLAGETSQEDFCEDINPEVLLALNNYIKQGDLRRAKMHLPEAFMQERVWVFNYKTLRNMLLQRHNHKLLEWQIFLVYMLRNIEHPELLPTDLLMKMCTIFLNIYTKNICHSNNL